MRDGVESALEWVSAELARLKARVIRLEGPTRYEVYSTREVGMWYDLRCGDVVRERLGLSELKQELTNVLEGQGEDAPPVVVARHGSLPAEKKASRGRKRKS